MKPSDIAKNLTEEEVIIVLTELGSDYPREIKGGLAFSTVCHNDIGEGKHKLYYYFETNIFYCYTNCGNIGNIFSLVMQINDCEFKEAFKFVCDVLGISMGYRKDRHGFASAQDNSFLNKFNNKKKDKAKLKMDIKDDSVLDLFYKYYHQTWLNDNITIEVMIRFNIRYDIERNSIIIPHYNIDGKLVGIRCRNLNKDLVDAGMKYIPVTVDGVMYNYPTALNLYGLNINKDAIRRYKKIIIGEAEKFVMQHYSYYGDDSIAVALNGSSFHDEQIEILKELGVEEVVFALDKEHETKEEGRVQEAKIIEKMIKRLQNEFIVSVLWDVEDLINLKDAPTDHGKDVFEKLYNNRYFY